MMMDIYNPSLSRAERARRQHGANIPRVVRPAPVAPPPPVAAPVADPMPAPLADPGNPNPDPELDRHIRRYVRKTGQVVLHVRWYGRHTTFGAQRTGEAACRDRARAWLRQTMTCWPAPPPVPQVYGTVHRVMVGGQTMFHAQYRCAVKRIAYGPKRQGTPGRSEAAAEALAWAWVAEQRTRRAS